MYILVINCGSSSVKAGVVDSQSGRTQASLDVQRIGVDGGCEATVRVNGEPKTCSPTNHQQALKFGLAELLDAVDDDIDIGGVGHRVVHGGGAYDRPVSIDQQVEQTIDELSSLAPLHNPANLAGIRAAKELVGDLVHVAVFDTAFHRTLPRRATRYAIPPDVAETHNVERFGFHGISHQYLAQKTADYFEADVRELRLITCHLGGGCSVAAVEYGRSVETSMGMTPLEGLVMGTRSGDIDPGAVIHLLRQEGWDVDRVDDLLNRHAGLAGLSGAGQDLRDIEGRAADGDERCRMAIQVFAHRVRKYIGAYAAIMGGADAIVFAGGIGQNSALMRHRICQRLDYLGARLDEAKNRQIQVDRQAPVASFSAQPSRCCLLAAATDEQHGIARQASRLVADNHRPADADRTIPIAISARHVHLTQEKVEALFGPGHELTPRHRLSQPGQFASEETVTLVGPKAEIKGVRILGPTRSYNQVEISRTDEFTLGIDAPIRGSGDLAHTPGITLRGPDDRQVTVDKGLICALRHIHMTPDDARAFGVKHHDTVEVEVTGGARDLTFADVLIRIKKSYKLEMHIDTDEGNAAQLGRSARGTLVETDGKAAIRRRRTRYDQPAE